MSETGRTGLSTEHLGDFFEKKKGKAKAKKATARQPRKQPAGAGAAEVTPPVVAAPPPQEQLRLDKPLPSPEERWDARNRKMNFFCPVDMRQRIAEEIATTKLGKTQIIVAALEEYFARRDRGKR